MRLTKLQLKRIIRETLKRQGALREGRYGRGRLLRESGWQMNPEMGGPEDQFYPEGTSIRQAASEAISYISKTYGDHILLNCAEFCRTGADCIKLARGWDTEGEAMSDVLESGDIRGSGNYDLNAFADELARQFSKMGV